MPGRRKPGRRWLLLLAVVAVGSLVTGVAGASAPWTTVSTDFKGPLFGLSHVSGKSFLVADGGAGPTLLEQDRTSLVAELPGVNDAVDIGRGEVLAAVTGETSGVFKVGKNGEVDLVANIGAYEAENDPAGDGTDEGSNPFDLGHIGRLKTLVADAAGNSLLHVDNQGGIDWVATFPADLVECPEFICGEPGVMMPAQAVPTSVAIGPDGAYYVGELRGFPSPTGYSRVWRIEPGTRHAECGSSPACTIVGTGFTSIIDVAFGPKGKLYVVELDEAGWLAMEEGLGTGGTINECSVGGTLSCSVRAGGLPIPTAVAFYRDNLYATILSLVEGQAQVAIIP